MRRKSRPRKGDTFTTFTREDVNKLQGLLNGTAPTGRKDDASSRIGAIYLIGGLLRRQKRQRESLRCLPPINNLAQAFFVRAATYPVRVSPGSPARKRPSTDQQGSTLNVPPLSNWRMLSELSVFEPPVAARRKAKEAAR